MMPALCLTLDGTTSRIRRCIATTSRTLTACKIAVPELAPTPMSHPLQHFDFNLLNDPDFREDSVREEIVVPLLGALGYSASPPHKIVRSRPLPHPYVYIGTAKKSVTIIPDYLLQRDGNNAWILDAKAPAE